MPSRRSRSTTPPAAIAPAAINHFRPHPWHGLEVGPDPPALLNAYIEITPFDLMKYEVDKASGYLRVDRPQRSSAQHPSLYGFIPRTYCGDRVSRLAPGRDPRRRRSARHLRAERTGHHPQRDHRPARVIGGLQMVDRGEADDKIISVLDNDYVWGDARDLRDLPSVLVERLQHYFLTYRLVPGEKPLVSIARVYGRAHAIKVVRAAMDDYVDTFAR